MGSANRRFYRWKAKYGGMTASDALGLKNLDEEKGREKLLAEAMLDVSALKDLLGKTEIACARKEAALRLMMQRGYSQRRACRLIDIDPKTVRRKPQPDASEVRARLRALAAGWRRFGYRRLGICSRARASR